MTQLLEQLGWQVVWLPMAAAILAFLAWRGMLGNKALDRGPTRDLDLTLPEAGVGAVLGPLSVFLLGLPAMMALIYRASQIESGFRKVGLVPRWPLRDVGWAAVAVPIAFALSSGTSVLMLLVSQAVGLSIPDTETGHKTLETLQQTNNIGEILGIILLAAVLAPLIEEVCFRGVMQTALLRLSGTAYRWHALLVTAMVFGLIHYSVITSWHVLPSLVVLGLVFGYVYERTGSMLCCVLVHAGFNACSLGIVLLPRVM